LTRKPKTWYYHKKDDLQYHILFRLLSPTFYIQTITFHYEKYIVVKYQVVV
jgi:hypothetical protein